MTLSSHGFLDLSKDGLKAFADLQAKALGVEIAPAALEEVIEDLAGLQGHARIFLKSPLAVSPKARRS